MATMGENTVSIANESRDRTTSGSQATGTREDEALRPARRQVSRPITDQTRSNDMMMYNIWEDTVNRTGGRRERGKIIASDYKCHPQVDSGWTRGERGGTRYICLYFARGLCHHGSECAYVHRVPDAGFELYHMTQPQYDIFGRERSLEVEGGQKGIGSMSRDCTTLYIYLGALASLNSDTVRDMVWRDFGEWGEIEDVNIVPRKSVGFVRYVLRSSSEFAKAAMHQQILHGDQTKTVLDVRWANDDPNPKAIERVKAKREALLAKAYMVALSKLPADQRAAKCAEIELYNGHQEDAVTSTYPVLRNMENTVTELQSVDISEQEEDEEDDIQRYLSPEDWNEIQTNDIQNHPDQSARSRVVNTGERKRPRDGDRVDHRAASDSPQHGNDNHGLGGDGNGDDRSDTLHHHEDQENLCGDKNPLAGYLAGYESSE